MSQHKAEQNSNSNLENLLTHGKDSGLHSGENQESFPEPRPDLRNHSGDGTYTGWKKKGKNDKRLFAGVREKKNPAKNAILSFEDRSLVERNRDAAPVADEGILSSAEEGRAQNPHDGSGSP